MGALLAVALTPANEAKWRQLSALAQRVQEVTREAVELLYADASSSVEAASAAQEQGMHLVVVQRAPRAVKALSFFPRGGWWSAVSPG